MTLGEEQRGARELAWRDSDEGRRAREATAATILAALIVRGAPLEADNLAVLSVTLTDALRAALAVKP